MELLESCAAMAAWGDARRGTARIGLVPTMGFLHAGHASLMDLLRPRVDQLVVSIYVNPLQFAPEEDLSIYPRDLQGDTALCAEHGVDAVWAPPTLYPPGFSTTVSVRGLTDVLEGEHRPTHFNGVTTVVARLMSLSRCDEAVFGEKDYQQLAVLRRMTVDLGLPVQVVPAPLIRDTDGLALSSRNTFLSPDERARGLSLHRALFAMRQASAAGEVSAEVLLAIGHALLGVDSLDYLALVDASTLQPVSVVEGPSRALVAGHVGRTRLIDNVAIGPEFQWT